MVGLTGGARRMWAVVVGVAFCLALPIAATAKGEAAPVTLADWMRTIFVTPDRKVDPSQQAAGVVSTPVPVKALQTSSEPTPPNQPIQRTALPRLFFKGGLADKKRRHRRR